MAKPELGTKRLCGNCGAKFYDLSKDPIVCPKCDTVLELARRVARAVAAGACRARAAAPAPVKEEVGGAGDAGRRIRFARGRRRRGPGQEDRRGDAVEGDEDEIEIEDEPIDDAAFIEEQEEGDDDVTDIIGDATTRKRRP